MSPLYLSCHLRRESDRQGEWKYAHDSCKIAFTLNNSFLSLLLLSEHILALINAKYFFVIDTHGFAYFRDNLDNNSVLFLQSLADGRNRQNIQAKLETSPPQSPFAIKRKSRQKRGLNSGSSSLESHNAKYSNEVVPQLPSQRWTKVPLTKCSILILLLIIYKHTN